MNDWTEGYVADHAYEHYYFPMLAPGFLEARLLLSGLDFPSRDQDEPLHYLELGYGQGLSLNFHAATNQDIKFWGTDFLPEQTLNARELSLSAELGTHLLNYSFAELDELTKTGKLPLFDIIVLHGVWSWISEENQQHIQNIIRTSLKPGGVVYISYNAMPQRAMLMPVRELMTLHANRKGASKDSLTRATEAASLLYTLSNANAAFFSDNPAYQSLIEDMQSRPASYLAHEYLNQSWHASYFFEMAKSMTFAGCRFVTPANSLESSLATQPEKTRSFLSAVTDPVSWETLKDFNLNIGFRMDIFVRDGIALTEEKRKARLDHSFWAMIAPLEETKTLSVKLSYTWLDLDRAVYLPILEVFAENHYAPKSLGTLHQHPRLSKMTKEDLLSCIQTLFSGNYIFPAQPSPSEKTVTVCRRLNRIMCDKTANGDVQQYLASPVLGRALGVAEHIQLFLRSYADGKKDLESWAHDAFTIMKAQGKSLAAKSEPDAKEGLSAFLDEAKRFEKTLLPYLKTMGAMPAFLSEIC